jgi:hypothetical protein
MKPDMRRSLTATLIAMEVASAALAWRDLSHRSESEIRGSKRGWRMIILANPGNSTAYWVFGRRSRSQCPPPDRVRSRRSMPPLRGIWWFDRSQRTD